MKIKEEIEFKLKVLQFKKTFFIELVILTYNSLTEYNYKNVYKALKKINTYKISIAIYKLPNTQAPRLYNDLSKIFKTIFVSKLNLTYTSGNFFWWIYFAALIYTLFSTQF